MSKKIIFPFGEIKSLVLLLYYHKTVRTALLLINKEFLCASRWAPCRWIRFLFNGCIRDPDIFNLRLLRVTALLVIPLTCIARNDWSCVSQAGRTWTTRRGDHRALRTLGHIPTAIYGRGSQLPDGLQRSRGITAHGISGDFCRWQAFRRVTHQASSGITPCIGLSQSLHQPYPLYASKKYTSNRVFLFLFCFFSKTKFCSRGLNLTQHGKKDYLS